ncbi:LacI family DNA-binding transcriptional regulator [Cellulomonas telluris]|uniref:LacI family DNA-binding transcriptional regulator n=1 Tax=Cellulomonas telluris TaxID=2306636 RepID=UPI0010A92658|nr:LacI family DNA-binding transcriptional regulator [Cellulomonas telluris]
MPRSGPPRPTIVDVARAAGVSKSLVSAALRGDAGVSADSRRRVADAAHALGYRRNGWAQRLVSGRSELLGVLLTDLRNGYHTDIVNGLEDAAAAAGYGVVLAHGRQDPALLRRRLADLVGLGVDAVVAVTARLDERDLADAAARLPVVVVGRPRAVPDGVGWVSNDDETGARLAVEHLLAAGHTRIAFLTASDRPAATARRDAYRAAAGTTGLEFDARADGVERLLEAVRRPGGPTAAFAANDRVAVGLLAAAADRGVAVPGELAVVGYDNTELAELVRPRLTSVDQPRAAMGRAAASQALALLDGGPAGREVAAPTLVVRESSRPACPPSSR